MAEYKVEILRTTTRAHRSIVYVDADSVDDAKVVAKRSFDDDTVSWTCNGKSVVFYPMATLVAKDA